MGQEQTTSTRDKPAERAGGKDRAKFSCSFCGKKQADVWRLIAGPGVYICNDCIELCLEILTDYAGRQLDAPATFRTATRRPGGGIDQISFSPTPETCPPGTRWMKICQACGALNVGAEIDACLHCAARLPRPGEPNLPPLTPWHVGFTHQELRSFAPALRATLELAQEEAGRLHHADIGTEHLLLGLLRHHDSAAAALLAAEGVTLDATRQSVLTLLGPAQGVAPPIQGYSPRARDVLRAALTEARRLGLPLVGTEHVLLALLQEGQGVGAQTLVALGVDLTSTAQRAQALVHAEQG